MVLGKERRVLLFLPVVFFYRFKIVTALAKNILAPKGEEA